MYTMKQACELTGMTYETLKYYCNEGLVPNIKRSEANYRLFDEHNINWIKDLVCLKKCGMNIQEIKEYLDLCLQGERTIPQRQIMLAEKKAQLKKSIEELSASIDYIEWKETFYNGVLDGSIKYQSNLIKAD